MMRRLGTTLLTACIGLLFSTGSWAGPPKGDGGIRLAQFVREGERPPVYRPPAKSVSTVAPNPTIERKLRLAGLKYKVNSIGNFELKFTTSGRRKQLTWVFSKPSVFRNMKTTRICSRAFTARGAVPTRVAQSLLKASRTLRIGHWTALKERSITYLEFCAKMEYSQDHKTLNHYIQFVTTTADSMEKALTGTDKY
jgi:hypothetical protein